MFTIISVIIPVFNSEKYINKCVTSFSEIRDNRIEIILVNDGSTDSSLELCLKLKEKYQNIRIYNIKNSGPGFARNFGVKKAKGKYIFFCDSDDFVDTQNFQDVVKFIADKDYELIIFNKYYEGNYNGYKIELLEINDSVKNMLDIYKFTFKIKLSAAWRKIFRKNIICDNNIEFPINQYLHEDLCFFVNYLQYIDSYELYGKPVYYHRFVKGSLSNSIDYKNFEDFKKTYLIISKLANAKKLNELYLNYTKNAMLRILMGIIFQMKINGCKNEIIIKELEINQIGEIFSNIKINIVSFNYLRLWFFKKRKFDAYYYILKFLKGRKTKRIKESEGNE